MNSQDESGTHQRLQEPGSSKGAVPLHSYPLVTVNPICSVSPYMANMFCLIWTRQIFPISAFFPLSSCFSQLFCFLLVSAPNCHRARLRHPVGHGLCAWPSLCQGPDTRLVVLGRTPSGPSQSLLGQQLRPQSKQALSAGGAAKEGARVYELSADLPTQERHQ